MSECIRNSEINHYWEGREWLDQGWCSLGPGLNSSAYRNHRRIPNQKEQGESKANLKTGRRYSHRKESFLGVRVCERERQTDRMRPGKDMDRGGKWMHMITCSEKKYSIAVNLKTWTCKSCPTLCDPMDYTVHGILQSRILEWVALLQGIFPTQGSNQGLLHCRQIFYQLSYQGSELKKRKFK